MKSRPRKGRELRAHPLAVVAIIILVTLQGADALDYPFEELSLLVWLLRDAMRVR